MSKNGIGRKTGVTKLLFPSDSTCSAFTKDERVCRKPTAPVDEASVESPEPRAPHAPVRRLAAPAVHHMYIYMYEALSAAGRHQCFRQRQARTFVVPDDTHDAPLPFVTDEREEVDAAPVSRLGR